MADEQAEVFDIDAALTRMDEINEELAAGKLELSKSIELYKEGVLLATKCKEHLTGVEQELQEFTQES
ncbi:MAG: exodeoxyribonuclease VII small subunit [Eubacterium sp.]|nr:exodeoxyribonuclease VII small subunit [Eubacterium sp.]